MRAAATVLFLALLAAAPAAGQRASRVAATAHVPRILQLMPDGTRSTEPGPATGELEREEEVRLRVRSNVPWRLMVFTEAADGGVEGIPAEAGVRVVVRQATGNVVVGPGTEGPGDPAVGVELARSSARGDAWVTVALAWTEGGLEGGRTPRLIYTLEELD